MMMMNHIVVYIQRTQSATLSPFHNYFFFLLVFYFISIKVYCIINCFAVIYKTSQFQKKKKFEMSSSLDCLLAAATCRDKKKNRVSNVILYKYTQPDYSAWKTFSIISTLCCFCRSCCSALSFPSSRTRQFSCFVSPQKRKKNI